MTATEEERFITEVPQWAIYRDGVHRITREFNFQDFKTAVAFVNRVAVLAEGDGHHPIIIISFNRLRLDLFTHAIGGLSINDFIVAAKIDALERSGE